MGWKGANTKANQKKRHRKQRKKKDGSEERLFQDYLGQDKSLIAAQAEELFVVDVPNGKGKNEKPTKTEFFQQKKLASEIIAQDARKHLTSVTRSSGTSKPSIFLFNKISNLSKRSDLPSYHQIINQNKNSNQLPSSNQNTSTIANFNLWEDESALITEEEMEAKGNPWIKKEVTSKPVPVSQIVMKVRKKYLIVSNRGENSEQTSKISLILLKRDSPITHPMMLTKIT
eukprot:TRINITY_DN3686_c0_g1_i3.p1 TRINITY_DN3686_c0_g1~~TRINITY_DN3686_c0_g1_i3.p1  ORF type:complete len:229 (-),score=77.33 TRINITY_DN3686_c0_g1_i3:788-1474(-)